MSSQGPNDSAGNDHNPHRRASFSPGSSLTEFFSSNRQPSAPTAYPGPITTAAAQANHRRRMSISGGSPPHIQTNMSGFRRGSVSSMSSTTSTADESAIEDGESGSPSSVGTSPFARRMSWGARALRDVRIPAWNSTGYAQPSPGSPTVTRGFLPENSKASTDMAVQRRRESMSTLQPPTASVPPPKESSVDSFQERMLKGELYMD